MDNLPPETIPIRPRPTDCLVPLTIKQVGVLNDARAGSYPTNSTRMCAASIRLVGNLDTSALQDAIRLVEQRHEALRTKIKDDGGILSQTIEPPAGNRLVTEEFSSIPSHERDSFARDFAQRFVSREVEILAGPLFEARLLRLSARDHVFILAVDHIVVDDASCGILRDEIWRLYESLLLRTDPNLPLLAIQFPDFAVWQHVTQERWVQDHLPYWQQKLRAGSSMRIPSDHGESVAQQPSPSVLYFPFGRRLTDELRRVARESQALLPLLILTVYVVWVFCRYSSNCPLITFLSHGRHAHPGLRGVIGDFSTFVYLRVSINHQETFLDLLHQITIEFTTASRHDASRLSPPWSTQPNSDFYFNWLPEERRRSSDGSGEPLSADRALERQPFPLHLSWFQKFAPIFRDTPSGITMTVVYQSELFDRRTIERFGRDLRWLAAKFVEKPLASLRDITLPP